MRVMGLDLSTRMGVSIVGSGKKVLLANEYEFPGSNGIERCYHLAETVCDLHREWKPDAVYIEGYSFASTTGLVYGVEIGTAVKLNLWERDIPYVDVPPGTLKKFVTGAGNSNKEIVMLQLFKRFGYEAKTNNIADAVALGLFGLCTLMPADFTKAQQEAVRPPSAKPHKR